MTFGHQLPTVTASGSIVAFTGAVVAGQSNADVGNAAMVVAFGGLITAALGGLTQLVKLIIDAKGNTARVKLMEADLAKTRGDLAESRDRNHKVRNQMQGIIYELQAKADFAEKKAVDAAVRAARLEGQLGITEKIHSEAINANADNIVAVAQSTGTALPAPTPHVEPIASGSGDDFEPFLPRFPDNHGPDGPLDSRINPTNPR